MKRYLPAAYSCAILLRHVFKNELRLAPPVRYVLTETPEGKAYLFAVMDEANIGKSITRYTNPALLHQLSTALKGRPVYLSNTTGLRYGVLLSPRRDLPKSSLYPGSLEDTFNLGLLSPERHLVIQPQEMQNVLLVGDMGSGKSNLLRLLALAGIETNCELYLADPEENTFGGAYWDSVCATGMVAGSQMDFIEMLDQIAMLLDERKRLYQDVTTGMISPNNLAEYNARAETPIKRAVAIVDEANSYLDDPKLNTRLFELARRARKWGVNLILAAHSWRGNDVATSLRAMFQTRIALHTEERTSAEVVLGQNAWAQKVLRIREPGRGIIRYQGSFSVFQSHFVPEGYELTGGKPVLQNSHFETLIRRAQLRPGGDSGKLDIAFSMQVISQPRRFVQALLESMEDTGLLEKRPERANARYITPKAISSINLEI